MHYRWSKEIDLEAYLDGTVAKLLDRNGHAIYVLIKPGQPVAILAHEGKARAQKTAHELAPVEDVT